MYICRNDELIITKATRSPISIHLKEKEFVNNEIDLQKGDCFYIFSDGYIDQFGGKNGRKFMAKNFKKMLLAIQDKNMQEQKQHIEDTFNDWRGKKRQLDDVVVLGVKI